MAPTEKLPPKFWITRTAFAVMFVILSFLIMKRELKKRFFQRQIKVEFTTKILQYSSLMGIISSFITFTMSSLGFFNITCIFGRFIGYVFVSIQFTSMGFYQLSRLYYCFANSQIHSNRGYPKWLFIIMCIIGIIVLPTYPISILYSASGTVIKSHCGISGDDWYHYYQDANPKVSSRTGGLWAIASLIYFIWDITTILLYVWKIRLFKQYHKESQPIVYKRILSILYKIFILTLFYEVATVISVVTNIQGDRMIINAIMGSFRFIPPFSYCYAMFLMMDHNHSEYIMFLRVIAKLRLHICCCCCCGYIMVKEQLNEVDAMDMDDKKALELQLEMQETQKNNNMDDSDKYETRNMSEDDQKITSNGNELSTTVSIEDPMKKEQRGASSIFCKCCK